MCCRSSAAGGSAEALTDGEVEVGFSLGPVSLRIYDLSSAAMQKVLPLYCTFLFKPLCYLFQIEVGSVNSVC